MGINITTNNCNAIMISTDFQSFQTCFIRNNLYLIARTGQVHPQNMTKIIMEELTLLLKAVTNCQKKPQAASVVAQTKQNLIRERMEINDIFKTLQGNKKISILKFYK